MEQKRIPDLLLGFETALRAWGLSASSVLYNLHCCSVMLKMHEERGAEYLEREIVADYTTSVRKRYDDGEIGRVYHNNVMRNINRFLEYAETGKIVRENPRKGSRYTLTPEFERIADGYLASGKFHPNTRNDMRWVVHKYFSWLTSQGFSDLNGVGVQQLQQFLVDCAKQLTWGSVYDVKLHLRKLYAYLYETNQSVSPFAALLSFRIDREVKVYPGLPQDDIAKMLSSINRKTAGGKRAYAVMTLGAQLGLRACDVVALKLTDIDWVNGEIKIRQAKTGRAVVLPLTESVGEALREYILGARRGADSKYIFERLKAPYTPLQSAVTIGEIYRDCCKAAGIGSTKRFHTLRRSLGTAMSASGVSVETGAQVLGDGQINSMKQYIYADSKHLKMCALPFDGIAPTGGDA